MKRAVLVGANINNDAEFDVSMKELAGLAEACGYEAVGQSAQNLAKLENATYIGSGKVRELKAFIEETDADCAIFLNALSPSQLSNLTDELGVEVTDKTGLILNIFSERAKTKEAKMQVEAAKLKYMLPRLVGLRKNLSRQGGTGGSMSNKGAGEKQIELDRRHIEKRLAELTRGLSDIESERETQRHGRKREGMPQVALVGYTNAGKSTLLNAMIEYFTPDEDKKVMAKDMLFATLDTTVRRINTGNNKDFLLSDTVGFIHGLPHELVKAFRSTLDEAKNADLIVEVADYSDENLPRQMKVTEETLKELGASHIPVIYVMNKADKVIGTDEFLREALAAPGEELPLIRDDRIFMSAKSGAGIRELAEMINEKLFEDFIEAEFLIPYEKGAVENSLRKSAHISETEYREDGVYIKCMAGRKLLGKYREYVI